MASLTDERTSSARRRTESVRSSSTCSSSSSRSASSARAGVGDRVDGTPPIRAHLRDQPLFLELREPWVDGAGARRVRAAEAVAERLDELVAVHPRVSGRQDAEQVPAAGGRARRRESCVHLMQHRDVAGHGVRLEFEPVLVQLAVAPGVRAAQARDRGLLSSCTRPLTVLMRYWAGTLRLEGAW